MGGDLLYLSPWSLPFQRLADAILYGEDDGRNWALRPFGLYDLESDYRRLVDAGMAWLVHLGNATSGRWITHPPG